MDLSLDLDLVIARLDTLTSDGTLRMVGGALDIPSAEEEVKQIPAAFVVPGRENGSGQRPVTSARQLVVESFNVVHVVSNRRGDKGVAARSELRTLRGHTRGLLVGWSPDSEEFDTFMWERGGLLSLSQLQLWWVDAYRTEYYVAGP